MIDKIKEYLRSNDLEMVRLGATLLQSVTHSRNWDAILKECSEDGDHLATENSLGHITYSFPTVKWRYKIVSKNKRSKHTIEIYSIDEWYREGMWQQLDGKYTHVYNPKTFTINTFSKAVNAFHTQKVPAKRAFKIHNKIKHK